MDPLVAPALTAAGGGVSLLNNILTLVREAQKGGQAPNLADVLAAACPEAFKLAGRFVKEVQDVRQKLLKAEVDLGKTERELLSDTRWWRFKRYRLVHAFGANIDSLSSQVSLFLDDIVSVGRCCEADDFIATSFAQAAEMRTVLHGETDPSIPVGTILDNLEHRAQSIRTALGDICG